MRLPWLAAIPLALLLPTPAGAHGLWGHIHVTGWAVENMPDDELRRFLLDDPEVFNALLFGAVFTDSGYALDDGDARTYSETAHWEPFVQAYIEWMRVNEPPPWDDLASRKRVAFLLGIASHGLQDSIFDSLFLSQVEERDGVGQDATDPGTDGFLALDGHIRFVPERDIPFDAVQAVYASMGIELSEELVDEAVGRVTAFYINGEGGIGVAEFLGEQYAPEMPWGRVHYLDPEVPGSLRAEIFPTMRYQQAVWKRLNGQLEADELEVWAFPEEPRRLRSGDPDTVDSWITLVFGQGVEVGSVELSLVDDAGSPVAFTAAGTRWGADPTRLVRLQPAEPLQPGAWYTAGRAAGASTIDGQTTTGAWELRFQVACESETDPACPDLGELPVASIDGIPDAGAEDSGAEDSGAAVGYAGGGGCGCSVPRKSPSGRSAWPAALFGLGMGLLLGARRRR